MVGGYGFMAVFFTALTMSSYEEEHEYHTEMHDFVLQVERILMVVLLILFGGSLVSGILDHLTWNDVFISLAFLFIVRPLTSLVAIYNMGCSWREKMAISFFGIRGIGSFFYLSFALSKIDFVDADRLWSIVAFIVMVSIILHGVSASRVMDYLDLNRRKSFRKPQKFQRANQDAEKL
jgi:NhaP-type Na+/H+ or K+/H+ antiporter